MLTLLGFMHALLQDLHYNTDSKTELFILKGFFKFISSEIKVNAKSIAFGPTL